jgi:hypothetical protein
MWTWTSQDVAAWALAPGRFYLRTPYDAMSGSS